MQIFGVIFFSSFNEVFNYILLLYLMRKAVTSKAAVYGVMSSVFSILFGLIKSYYEPIQICATCLYLVCYTILFFERRRDKYSS